MPDTRPPSHRTHLEARRLREYGTPEPLSVQNAVWTKFRPPPQLKRPLRCEVASMEEKLGESWWSSEMGPTPAFHPRGIVLHSFFHLRELGRVSHLPEIGPITRLACVFVCPSARRPRIWRPSSIVLAPDLLSGSRADLPILPSSTKSARDMRNQIRCRSRSSCKGIWSDSSGRCCGDPPAPDFREASLRASWLAERSPPTQEPDPDVWKQHTLEPLCALGRVCCKTAQKFRAKLAHSHAQGRRRHERGSPHVDLTRARQHGATRWILPWHSLAFVAPGIAVFTAGSACVPGYRRVRHFGI